MAKEKVVTNPLSIFLQQSRNLARLSQGDVSEKLGYSTPQFVSNWERGVSAPPVNVLKKLAQMYSISADELFEMVLGEKVEETTKDLRRKFYGR